MSDYGADADPNKYNMYTCCHKYQFTKPATVQGDQYTISGSRQVLKFCDGTNRVNVRMLVNPSELS